MRKGDGGEEVSCEGDSGGYGGEAWRWGWKGSGEAVCRDARAVRAYARGVSSSTPVGQFARKLASRRLADDGR